LHIERINRIERIERGFLRLMYNPISIENLSVTSR